MSGTIVTELREPTEFGKQHRFLDLTGQKFSNLTAVRHLGFRYGGSVWRFECDCGQTVDLVSSLVAKNQRDGKGHRNHCGCRSAKGLDSSGDDRSSPSYRYWLEVKRRNRNGLPVVDDWLNSYRSFRDQCWSTRDGRNLVRIDRTQPLGPLNFRWSDRTEKGMETLHRAVQLLVECDGMTHADALQRLSGLSRQRVHKIIESRSVASK